MVNTKTHNFITAKASVIGASESIKNEILAVLKSTKFNKISFCLSSPRRYFDESVAADDTRIITVGYIKKYDPKNEEFTLVIFNNLREVVETFENPVVEVIFTEVNGKLGTITKLNIIPGDE